MRRARHFSWPAVVVFLALFAAAAPAAELLNQLGIPVMWGSYNVPFNEGDDRWVADDFTPGLDCTIEEFACQFIRDGGTATARADLHLRIYTGGLSGEPVWEVTVPADELEFSTTGDLYSAQRVYRVNAKLRPGDHFNAYAGTTYWVAWRLNDEPDCRNLTVNNGGSAGSRAWRYADEQWDEIGVDADAAFYLGGAQPGSVYATSFGYIKAAFR
ncbi:MAG TPA: hypothetical protein ENN88_03055 [Candidatus Coatesbacteria bacterium]|nr:hypothetical protein [Candidatus Coatesbacteria bacterium]